MPRRPKLPGERDRRERGTGRLYFDKSKARWVAAVTYDGRITKRLLRTKPEAEAALKDLTAKADRKQLAKTQQTFDEYIADWLVEHVLVNLSKRTYEAYKGKIAKHISPHFGSRRIASIEPRHIRELYRILREEGTWTRHKAPKRRLLSPTTIATIHVVLHSAFEWAVRDERIPINPCDRVHPPKKGDYEAQTFDAERVPELLAAIRDHRYEPLWRLQLASATRHGEATGVREQDVNEQRMAIRMWEAIAYVPKALRDDPEVWWERKSTKTKRSRRWSPLTFPALVAIRMGREQAAKLREAAGESWYSPNQDLIFPDDDGRPLRESKVLKAWNKMLEANNLPKCRPHDLRHSAAEMALENGADLIHVSRWLGHASVAITDTIYAGKLTRGSRRAAERLAGSLGSEGAGKVP